MDATKEASYRHDDESWIRAEENYSPFDYEESKRARRLARTLHQNYQRERTRWSSYEALFAFLAFVALLLSALALQSDARIAFQVHSAIRTVIPSSTTMPSRQAVLDWIHATLQELWHDPVCGDGICATPFEFASYGRFGCRADCGKLPEVQTLTTLQIDLYYDFTHPVDSIASSELMRQAKWNLCPQNGAPHGKDCYYSEAQGFESLKGEVHRTLDDVPDGFWEVHIKRDYFHKIRGAVRVLERLKEQAMWSRKYGAYLAAIADQEFELSILTEAIRLGEITTYELTVEQIDNDLAETYSQRLRELERGDLTQEEFEVANQTLHDGASFAKTQYRRATCICDESVFGNACLDDSSGFEAETTPEGSSMGDTEICQKYAAIATTAVTNQLEDVRYALIVKRLGGSDDYTGKIGVRAAKKAEQKLYITNTSPELYDWIFATVEGTTPESDVELNSTKYDVLAKYFSDGPTAFVDPASLTAQSRLTRTAIQSATLVDLIERSRQRVVEIESQMNETMQLPVVDEMLRKYNTSPIVERLETELLPSFIDYNHAEWSGGADEYLVCDLGTRGPDYVGQCVDQITCTRDNNTAPYACPESTDLSAESCSQRCCFQEDCAAICDCDDSCGSTTFCSCEACTSLVDALETQEYRSLQDLAESSGSLFPGRKLKQEDADDSISQHLSDLSESVGALRTGQSELKTQVLSLEDEVRVANELMQQREEDSSLQDLINQGRQEIAEGQEAVEGLLVEIMGKQNETLEAVAEATATVKALEEMTTKSLEAQTALQTALREQMNAIKVAYQQNLITLDQAAELWKLARRERLVKEKDSRLSTFRCSSETVTAHTFEVDNYVEAEERHSRERYVGLNNRLVGGMLLHTTRTHMSKCPRSRFDDIQEDCHGGLSADSYGVDPVFKSGTTMYNPDLDNEESMVHFYNCSELRSPSYNRADPYSASGALVNQSPFCVELFNMRHVPYGFRSYDLKGKQKGFPVWLDINLSELEAEKWYRYLEEGLFLDIHTKSVTSEMVVYNPELNVFGYLEVAFDFTDGGEIKVSSRIMTARVELYQTPTDFFRLTLEIILTALVAGWLLLDLLEMTRAYRQTKSFMKSFASSWRWIDLISNVLMFITVLMWWIHVLKRAKPFDIDLSYDVYASLNPPAGYLRLTQHGKGLKAAHHDFSQMQKLVQSLSWYYAFNGASILLLIARMLKKMDFQPRLGVVTRSIALAGPDLLHFSVVFGLVFFGYAMMAQLIFGGSIESFSTFGRCLNTCFEVLLGDISISTQLKELSGLQSLIGILFFWSFELLVFLVLLNFLLAIIVDAFSVVKENTAETIGIHTEIFAMIKHKWRHLAGRLFDRKFIPYDRLDAMLRHYGTLGENDSESSDPPDSKASIKIQKAEIDARTLKVVLSQCLRDPHFENTLNKKNSLFGFQLSDGSHGLPSERDLDVIVSTLIQRFNDSEEDTSASSPEEDTTSHSSEHLTEMLLQWDEDLRHAQVSLTSSLDQLAALQKQILNKQPSLPPS